MQTEDCQPEVNAVGSPFCINCSKYLILLVLAFIQIIFGSFLAQPAFFLRSLHFFSRATIPLSTAAASSGLFSAPQFVTKSRKRVSTSKETLALSSVEEVLAVAGRKHRSSVSWLSSSVGGVRAPLGRRRRRCSWAREESASSGMCGRAERVRNREKEGRGRGLRISQKMAYKSTISIHDSGKVNAARES